MAKVYTKTGDAGSTGLYTGERVSKASQRGTSLSWSSSCVL